jgi:hypothetical protein
MLAKSLEDFIGKVETRMLWIALLQHLDHTKALLIMIKATMIFHEAIKSLFSGVAEGGVAQIVREGYCLREILVQPKGSGHGATE